MIKLFLFLGIFLFSIALQAAEPDIKLYLNDGSSKTFNIDDINVMTILQNNSAIDMKIFYEKTKTVSYSNKTIDSIRFEKVNDIMTNLLIFTSGSSVHNYIKLASIDSIVFVSTPAVVTVTIGTQVWMLRNLDVPHYRNGDPIPEITDSIQWVSATTGAWCYFNNDPANDSVYGKLYNWYAVNDSRGLAPLGWHVASDSDWTVLTDYLGGELVSGNKLRETGTTHWTKPNTAATNESGFTALPGGYRNITFGRIKDAAAFWMSTEVDATSAWSRYLFWNKATVQKAPNSKSTGFSVRCVKD